MSSDIKVTIVIMAHYYYYGSFCTMRKKYLNLDLLKDTSTATSILSQMFPLEAPLQLPSSLWFLNSTLARFDDAGLDCLLVRHHACLLPLSRLQTGKNPGLLAGCTFESSNSWAASTTVIFYNFSIPPGASTTSSRLTSLNSCPTLAAYL